MKVGKEGSFAILASHQQNTSKLTFPQYRKILEQLGEKFKLARKRRKLTTFQVTERSSIDRTTLYYIEKGKPSVAIGNYFYVLKTLNLHKDLLKVAADDELGRKLQELNL